MSEPSQQKPAHGANTVLLGMLIVICSCALIIAVRLHARVSSLVDAINDLTAEYKSIAARMAQGGGWTMSPPLASKNTDGTKPDVPDAVKTTKGTDPTTTETKAQPSETLPVSRTRSPLPQPGETITKPAPAPQFVEGSATRQPDPAATAPPPAPGDVINWSKAHEHTGQTITIAGKIVATNNIGNYCFLNFTTEARGGDKFHLVIYKEAFADFGGKPEVTLKDKLVHVTGKVELDPKGERPQIRIKGKEQVKVVD